MNIALLNTEIQEFINLNLNNDINKLALLKNPFPELNWIEILNQITAKSNAKEKLPTFFNTPNIFYPSKISIEQTSSEQTAKYKSTLISGENLIDLTGGFGVDDYYFSKKFKKVVHCELNEELSQIAVHNFKKLKVNNIDCICGDSAEILNKLNQNFSCIYIDPSRRNKSKRKVFMLKDCFPNVPELLSFYFNFSDKILIKTAPMLDITAGVLELKAVKAIHIIALDNEVKELLWEIEMNYTGEINIKTVNILKEKTAKFDFVFRDKIDVLQYSLPKKYLYEPNSAILKSGGFEAVSSFFKLEKLHQHSHLYTSNAIIDFPGRIFEINHCINYSKTEMKEFLENKNANVTIRNFPLRVDEIRKKWKIKEGGQQYCFFTTDSNNNKIVLICTKI